MFGLTFSTSDSCVAYYRILPGDRTCVEKPISLAFWSDTVHILSKQMHQTHGIDFTCCP